MSRLYLSENRRSYGRRAEIFVLIIAGTIPTLKPIWSKIRGKMPSVGSYVGSRKYQNKSSNHPYSGSKSGEIAHTGSSKASKGFGRRAPGSVTIALNEIDDITKREAGSSTESILHNDRSGHSATVGTQPSSSMSHGGSKNGSPTHSPRGHHAQPAIHVEQNFSVSYSGPASDIQAPAKTYRFP